MFCVKRMFKGMISKVGLTLAGETCRLMLLSGAFTTPGLMNVFMEAVAETNEPDSLPFDVRRLFILLSANPPMDATAVLKHCIDFVTNPPSCEEEVFTYDDSISLYELAMATRIKVEVYDLLEGDDVDVIKHVRLSDDKQQIIFVVDVCDNAPSLYIDLTVR